MNMPFNLQQHMNLSPTIIRYTVNIPKIKSTMKVILQKRSIFLEILELPPKSLLMTVFSLKEDKNKKHYTTSKIGYTHIQGV